VDFGSLLCKRRERKDFTASATVDESHGSMESSPIA
jgi:hypothetical protein